MLPRKVTRKAVSSNSTDQVPGDQCADLQNALASLEGKVSPIVDPEKHRTLTAMWLQTKPRPRALILRMIVEPIRQYQVKHSALTSKARHQQCQIEDVLAISSTPSTLKKAVPLYVILSGELEEEVLARTMMLLRFETLWLDILPVADQNVEHLAMAFMGLASQGGLVVEKLCKRRLLQPQKTLRIDLFPELEDEIMRETCPYMHLPWSASHAAQHLGEKSHQARQDGRAKRVHITLESDVTIGLLESLHAAVRRHLKTRGVQTHALDIVDLNAS